MENSRFCVEYRRIVEDDKSEILIAYCKQKLNLQIVPKMTTKVHKPKCLEWLVKLTAVPLGMGSNLVEGMDVCKYIVPARHGGTLNIRQAKGPFARLVDRKEKWWAPDHIQGVLSQHWDESEPNRTVTCTVLKATDNNRRKN
ncbi:uncharacterized protein TNCV_4804491 [Trichonephila clavipes]|nr:uncharacterized protein TNCV_4804491 [Trichonephila clavipes]